MGLETKSKTIGETTYHVTQLPSEPARKFSVRLFKVAGPAMVFAYKDNIQDALISLAQNLEEEDLERAVDLFLNVGQVEFTTSKGRPRLDKDMANIHFAGKTHELLQLIGFCLEVNYSGFLGAFRSAMNRTAGREMATDSTS